MRALLLLLFLLFAVSTNYLKSANNDQQGVQNDVIKKRYIHPQSKYIVVSSGFGFTSTQIKDPNNFLNQGLIMGNNTYFPNIMYEHGIKDNFFAETGYSYVGQGIMYKLEKHGIGSSHYGELYNNHHFQLGGGYRMINAKNYHFFNVHAGIFIGIANDNVSNLPFQIGPYIHTDNTTDIRYSVTREITHFSPVSLGTYLGISKEIRITSGIRFFAKYVQQFGFNSALKGNIILSSNERDFEHNATFNVRGGGAFISGGLKFQILRKKLSE